MEEKNETLVWMVVTKYLIKLKIQNLVQFTGENKTLKTIE